jgi:hypothetical protein
LLYVVDVNASVASGVMVVEVMTRDRKANGEWGKPRLATITAADIGSLPDWSFHVFARYKPAGHHSHH